MKTTITLAALSACLFAYTGNWWYFALFTCGEAIVARILFLREKKIRLDIDGGND